MSDKQLKPCPFCGQKNPNIYKNKYAWVISCTNADCSAWVSKHLQKAAIETWNRRAAHD